MRHGFEDENEARRDNMRARERERERRERERNRSDDDLLFIHKYI